MQSVKIKFDFWLVFTNDLLVSTDVFKLFTQFYFILLVLYVAMY